MKRLLVLAAVLGVIAVAVPAEASILPQTWVFNTNNVYEDQDRTAVFDMNNNGELDAGDVFVGYLRIDGRSLPTPGVDIPPSGPDGGLYGVFAHEVYSIQSVYNVVPGFNTHYMISGPVVNPAAVGWLDLPTLAPKTVPVGPGQGPAMVGVYEEVPTDLINNMPPVAPGNGVRTTILDYIRYIDTNGKLDLTLGIGVPPGEDTDGGPVPAPDDYWDSWINLVLAGVDTVPNLANTALFNLPSPVGANFGAGLSAIGLQLDPYLLEQKINTPIAHPLGGQPGDEHELVIESGEVTGAANIFFADPFFGPNNPFFGDPLTLLPGADGIFGTADDAFMPAEWNPISQAFVNFYGLSSNADMHMHPVPEPASVAIWATLLLGGAFGVYRRRRK